MENLFAERIQGVPRSFIREILRVSLDKEIISFAGGLPNPAFFPVKEIQKATAEVFDQYGENVLQYSNSEGEIELREFISKRYMEKKGLAISPENIFITNGSQQGIDLLSKVFLNRGDAVLIEEPGYLGAIQSLSLYQPQFHPVEVDESGMDVDALDRESSMVQAKMLYMVPTFQNPSGITYTNENREKIAEVAKKRGFILIEDDPYGELRFSGSSAQSFASYLPGQTVLLGSFSKVVAPGFRLGWIAAPEWICDKLIVAKQAADLHTSSFTQKIINHFLRTNDLDAHIAKITEVYGVQCRAMVDCIERSFPDGITITRPEGGMFLWGKLPEGRDAQKLFEEAVKEKVVFVPGSAFYTGDDASNCFRMNFSCVDPDTIALGIERMRRAIDRFM